MPYPEFWEAVVAGDVDDTACGSAGASLVGLSPATSAGISAFCQSSPSSTITAIRVPNGTSLEFSGFCTYKIMTLFQICSSSNCSNLFKYGRCNDNTPPTKL